VALGLPHGDESSERRRLSGRFDDTCQAAHERAIVPRWRTRLGFDPTIGHESKSGNVRFRERTCYDPSIGAQQLEGLLLSLVRPILALAGMLGLSAAAPASACEAITSLPAHLTAAGRYCLASDLTWDGPGAAITLLADSVEVDLAGHTLRGATTGDPAHLGVLGIGASSVVHGGTIEGFTYGAQLYGNDVSIRDLALEDVGYVAIMVRGDGATIRRTRVRRVGLAPGYPEPCATCTIPIGITVQGASATIEDNVVSDVRPVAEAVGVAVAIGPGAAVRRNRVANPVVQGGAFGFWFSSPETDVDFSGNWVQGWEYGVAFARTSGRIEANTWHDVNVPVADEQHLRVLDLGGNRWHVPLGRLPILAGAPVGIQEGTSRVDVALRLEQPVPWIVEVAWRTHDAEARAGADYHAAAGILRFYPGETERSVSLSVLDDGLIEPDERFQIVVESVQGAEVGRPGEVTIFDSACPTAPADSVRFSTEGGVQLVSPSSGCPGSWASDVDWLELRAEGSSLGVDARPHSEAADRVGRLHLPGRIVPVTQSGTGAPLPPQGSGSEGALAVIKPLLSWDRDGAAEDYTVEIRDTRSELVFHETREAAVVCEVEPCSLEATLRLPIELDRQPLTWRVRGRNDAGPGEWSVARALTVGEVDLQVPRGRAESSTPLFTWSPLLDADRYRLWLQTADGAVLLDTWFEAGACAGGVCTADPGIALAPGSYSWWVRGQANGTNGPWSLRADFLVAAMEVSVVDAEVVEGDAGVTEARVRVELSHAAAWPVSVSWSTRDGSAKAGEDYVAATGTLELAAGETGGEIRLEVNSDSRLELDESFEVVLGTIDGAVASDAAATVRIVNDDATAVLVAQPAAAPPGATVEVELTGGAGYATDWVGLFPAGSGDRSFLSWWYLGGNRTAPPSGMTTARFAITAPTNPGTYELRYFLANGYQKAATTTLAVAAPSGISVVDAEVVEGDAGVTEARVRVELSHAAAWPVSVSWSTRDGSAKAGEDYVAATGTLELAAGETGGEIRLEVNSDSRLELDEPFEVVLGTIDGAVASNAAATVRIVNDDATAVLVAQPAAVPPGATVEVELTGGAGYATDWVGLFQAGAGDRSFLNWWYLGGNRIAPPPAGMTTARFAITTPATPGTYELRYFLANGYQKAATTTLAVN
jgi:hypothetical protein